MSQIPAPTNGHDEIVGKVNPSIRTKTPSPRAPSEVTTDSHRMIKTLPLSQSYISCLGEDTPRLEEDMFLKWKDDSVSTICEVLSEKQRSALFVELIGRLPTNTRLYLVRNIQKIATVDFVSELPVELSLLILRLLQPEDLLKAVQVCTSWNKLISPDEGLWRAACISRNINLPDSSAFLPTPCSTPTCSSPTLSTSSTTSPPPTISPPAKPPISYRTFLLSHLRHINRLANNTGYHSKSVSEATGSPAHTSRALALCANTRYIYSGGEDRYLRCWERRAHTLVNEREGNAPSCMDCTEELVAAGLFDGRIIVLSSDLSRVITTCSRHMSPVYDVRWAGNTTVMSGSSDCTVRVWEIGKDSNTCQFQLRGHETMVNRVAPFFRGNHRTVFALEVECIRVWDLDDTDIVQRLFPTSNGYLLPNLVISRRLSSTGETVDTVVAGSSCGVHVWDALTYALIRIVKCGVSMERMVGAGSALIALTNEDTIVVVCANTGTVRGKISVPQFRNNNCAVWSNPYFPWLDGLFDSSSSECEPAFIVTTQAGDVASFYINSGL